MSSGALDLLHRTAAQLFEGACTPELQEQVEAGRFADELWTQLEENGLPMLLVSERSGGVGLSWPEVAGVLRLAGAFAVPLPLAETILAAQLLEEAGLDVPSGPLAIGLPRRGEQLELETSNDSFAVTGRLGRVPWASAVDHLVLVASSSDGPRVVSTSIAKPQRSSVEIASRSNAAGEPVAEVSFKSHSLANEDVGPGPIAIGLPLQRYALARSALLTGAMDRVLDLTIEHAREREQFGRPIARFQAVQQQVAELATQVAVVAAATEAAARALGSDSGELAVAATKARAGEAAGRVAAIAHQVHGAIGYTREHVLHRFTRRLWSWRDDAGHDREWQERVGELVLASGPQSLWELLCREA